MSQKFLYVFAIACSLCLLFPPEITASDLIHWGTKGVVAGVKHAKVKTVGAAKHASVASVAAAKGVAAGVHFAAKKLPLIPIIGAKKAFLLAPLALGMKQMLKFFD